MVQKLRERSNGESGFTLVELLVVMLILGLLAAIAIPAFFNQRDKAQDSEAKTTAQTAQTAMETYATDNDGDYTGGVEAELVAIEPTLGDAVTDGNLAVSGQSPTGYTITVTSDRDGDPTFGIVNDDGAIDHPCVVPADSRGGCPTGDDWG